MDIINVVVLSLSGLILVFAGSTRLFKPIKSLCLIYYSATPKIKLDAEVDIFNEMRAAGTSLAVAGMVILLGTFISQLTLTSFVVAIVIYIGHALGRVVSTRTEGKPNKQLAQALMSELIFGIANTICLVIFLL